MENDQLPGPDGNPRLPFLGLPIMYGGLPQTRIPAPRLTDDSVKGLYHATAEVPSRAVRVLNAVSTRIGAPALNGGASTVMKQVYTETPTVGAIQRRIPAFLTRIGSGARAWSYGWLSKIGIGPRG